MPTSRTIHVYKSAGAWAVGRQGSPPRSFRTQREALLAANQLAKLATVGQVAVHSKNGSVRVVRTFGMPPVLRPPRKSASAGRIASVVGTMALERLLSAPVPPRDKPPQA